MVGLIFANGPDDRLQRARRAAARARLNSGSPSRRGPSQAQMEARERFKRMVQAGRFKENPGGRGPSKMRVARSNPRARRNDSMPSMEAAAEMLLASAEEKQMAKKSGGKKGSKKAGGRKASKKTGARKASKKAAAKKAPKKARKAKAAAAPKASKPRKARKAAAPKAARKAASKPASKKRRKAWAPKYLTKAQKKKYLALHSAEMRAKKAGKAKRASGKKTKSTPKSRARRMRLSVMRFMGGSNTKALAKQYGIRTNPGIMGRVQALLPEIATVVIGTGLAAVIGSKIAAMVAEKAPASIRAHVPAIGAIAIGGAAFMALSRAKGRAQLLAPWALAGGVVAAAVHTLMAIKVKDSAGAEIALSRKLGLPFGDYVVGDVMVGDYHLGNYVLGAAELEPGVHIQGGDGIFGAIEHDNARREMLPPAEVGRHNTRRDNVDVAISGADDGIFN